MTTATVAPDAVRIDAWRGEHELAMGQLETLEAALKARDLAKVDEVARWMYEVQKPHH